jgi:hypothetical protein
MRRFAKMVVAGLLLASVSVSTAFADYGKGLKYFQKYIKKAHKIKSPVLLEKVGAKTPADLNALFKDNAKLLIKKLEAAGLKDEAKGVAKIAKKKKLKDLKDFFTGVLNGKLPAG